MDKSWFEMSDLLDLDYTKTPWVTIKSYQKLKEEGIPGQSGYYVEMVAVDAVMTAFSCTVPPDDCAVMMRTPYGHRPLVSPGEWYGEASLHFLSKTEHQTGQFLVLEQYFDNRKSSQREWHLLQDMVLALNLWRQDDAWFVPQDDMTEVARLSRDTQAQPISMEIRLDYLQDYLAARQMKVLVSRVHNRIAIIDNVPENKWPKGWHETEKRWDSHFYANDFPDAGAVAQLADALTRRGIQLPEGQIVDFINHQVLYDRQLYRKYSDALASGVGFHHTEFSDKYILPKLFDRLRARGIVIPADASAEYLESVVLLNSGLYQKFIDVDFNEKDQLNIARIAQLKADELVRFNRHLLERAEPDLRLGQRTLDGLLSDIKSCYIDVPEEASLDFINSQLLLNRQLFELYSFLDFSAEDRTVIRGIEKLTDRELRIFNRRLLERAHPRHCPRFQDLYDFAQAFIVNVMSRPDSEVSQFNRWLMERGDGMCVPANTKPPYFLWIGRAYAVPEGTLSAGSVPSAQAATMPYLQVRGALFRADWLQPAADCPRTTALARHKIWPGEFND